MQVSSYTSKFQCIIMKLGFSMTQAYIYFLIFYTTILTLLQITDDHHILSQDLISHFSLHCDSEEHKRVSEVTFQGDGKAENRF